MSLLSVRQDNPLLSSIGGDLDVVLNLRQRSAC